MIEDCGDDLVTHIRPRAAHTRGFGASRCGNPCLTSWLRSRNTIEFLGIWGQLNNPGFNPVEFDGIKNQAGLNSFVLTSKRWIEATGAIGQMKLLLVDSGARRLERKKP